MINKVLLVGKVSREPKGGQSESGLKYCHLNLATTSSYQGKQSVEYHRVSTFGDKVDEAMSLKEGDVVLIEGRIKSQSKEGQNGEKTYFTSIMASTICPVSSDASTGQNKPSERVSGPPPRRSQDNSQYGGTQYQSNDLPF